MKRIIISALMAISMMAAAPVYAQEENEFKNYHVVENFTDNDFQRFGDARLLCVGDKEKSNVMAIGWGDIGRLWHKTAIMVYVAEKRYTKEFMDKAEYFLVMSFDMADSQVLTYMG